MPTQGLSTEQLFQDYAAAVASKDSGAFMRLYDPGVRVFDAWQSWVYEGAPAWAAAVRNWFESLREEGVRVTFDETRVSGAPALAIVTAIVTYTGLSAQGEALRCMQNRITWAVRLSGPVPQIFHEHTSAPISFSDMKAILER